MYKRKDYLKRGFRFLRNRLLPGRKTLSSLMLYATDLCDSRCKHCLIWAKRPVKFMPLDKIIEIMNSKCITKDTVVGLEGGEFLLHPEADEILGWFAKHHPNFDLLSNCLKPDKVIQAVKSFKPKRLYISLDGTEETYQYMRGKDGYKSVIKVIEQCREHTSISLMFTLSPYNSFEDLKHVIQVSKQYGVDMRMGIYNDISFFDTKEKAHETNIASLAKTRGNQPASLRSEIPAELSDTSENLDFLLLYEEWRKGTTRLSCNSILDSVVIHPNGNVPICQNLDIKQGNVFESSLDEIFNGIRGRLLQQNYSKNCNSCWINYHRKYDVILFRTLEKFLPKKVIELFMGNYQWTSDQKVSYQDFMRTRGA